MKYLQWKWTKVKLLHIFKCQILATLFNSLGSLYTITQQRVRAINSLKRAYTIDHDDHESLFGVAWWHCRTDTEKRIKLFHQYLNAAPECDKKYHDVYHSLSYLYFWDHKDITKGKEYKGLDAEKPPTITMFHRWQYRCQTLCKIGNGESWNTCKIPSEQKTKDKITFWVGFNW